MGKMLSFVDIGVDARCTRRSMPPGDPGLSIDVATAVTAAPSADGQNRKEKKSNKEWLDDFKFPLISILSKTRPHVVCDISTCVDRKSQNSRSVYESFLWT